MDATECLLEVAWGVQRRAHAPYSGFFVGAALRVESGEVFAGCNVENGSYGLTMCAERVAVGAAVAAGHRRFEAIAIVSAGETPVSPCGACRQVLGEFGLDIVVVSEAGGKRMAWSLRDLLPAPFTFRDFR